ncbi:hypothetical protein NOK12_17500 [Nocardioides sp. OK12]|uniref:hypothetical protein n=1 Tax=Nocardioides sp. OK12 TaxID=2758661 RepID=UPI0021C37B58|nr:hypothetical protein [Nocardioides sp. OK12]GHJ59232.1 hypothetical protein NOK12_17500 [Nocardioides sp. OK12]
MSNDLTELVARAGDDIPVAAPPVGLVLAASRRRRRRTRICLGAAVAGLGVATVASAYLVGASLDDTALDPAEGPRQHQEATTPVAPEASQKLDPSLGAEPEGDGGWMSEGWDGETSPAGTFPAVADNGAQGYVSVADMSDSDYHCSSRPACDRLVDDLTAAGYLSSTGALTVPVRDADGTRVGVLTRGVVHRPGEPLGKRKNPAEGYPRNDAGQTYGADTGTREPDLVATSGDHGLRGYTLTAEQSPATPAQALEWQERWAALAHGPILNVYAEDGSTLLDTFTLQLGDSAAH